MCIHWASFKISKPAVLIMCGPPLLLLQIAEKKMMRQFSCCFLFLFTAWEIEHMKTYPNQCLICIVNLFRPHYNLHLQSIGVNGQLLPIDQGLFSTSGNRGTIIDSGTTLAYLVEGAYDPLVAAVSISIHFMPAFLNFVDATTCTGSS